MGQSAYIYTNFSIKKSGLLVKNQASIVANILVEGKDGEVGMVGAPAIRWLRSWRRLVVRRYFFLDR